MAVKFGRTELEEKLKELFNVDEITPLMNIHINKYVLERRWSYLDIARALAYFVEIQNGELKPQMGLGIVPYVIDESRRYFKQLEEKTKTQRLESEKFKEHKSNSYDIKCNKIPKPEKRNRRPLIDIGSISLEENEDG